MADIPKKEKSIPQSAPSNPQPTSKPSYKLAADVRKREIAALPENKPLPEDTVVVTGVTH
jgi:hypothetical protein